MEHSYPSGASNAIQNNHGWRARQRIPRNFQRPLAADVDLELLTDALHEVFQRRGKAVHRQHHRRTQPFGDLGYSPQRQGVGAVDRHHHNVEPSDRRQMAVVERNMQVPEMADAQPGDLEDEDRIAVADHFAAGILAPVTTDIGGDVADQHIADLLIDARGAAVVTPAVQYMRNG